MSNEFRLQRRKSRNNDKSQLIRSNSVEARIETNPRVSDIKKKSVYNVD